MSSNIIIGIHGLSNKPKKNQLAEWWEQAIREGLGVDRNIPRDAINFHSVYWADVTNPGGPQDPVPKDDAYKEAAPGEIKRYKDSWIDYLRAQTLDVIGDAVDAMKELFGMTATANEVLEKKLPDLHLYYTDKAVRDELRGRLSKVVTDNKGKRIMVVAHSMGSIIAYDVLREIGRGDPDCMVDHFVTIGSPLGLPHVKYKILKESPLIRTPSIVKKWTNLADRRDPVAVDIYLKDDYAENRAGVRVRDDLIMNDWGGIHHKSYGYLRCPEFTDLVRAFI